jgi:hypothetical protein
LISKTLDQENPDVSEQAVIWEKKVKFHLLDETIGNFFFNAQNFFSVTFDIGRRLLEHGHRIRKRIGICFARADDAFSENEKVFFLRL